MEPAFDLWSLFFLVAASQGVFLSILLFARKSPTNDLLAWLILSFGICMGYYVTFWTGYSRIWPWQLGALQGTTFLFGPFTYCYLLSTKKKTHFDAKHLIPALAYILYFLADHPPRFIPGSLLALAQIGHLFVYAYFIWSWHSKNRPLASGTTKRHSWQKKIALAYTGYSVSFLTYYILVWTGLIQLQYDYIISLFSAAFIYFIGYNGFTKQELLRMNETSRYDKSTLNDTASTAILNELKALMTSQKLYLEPSLKLQDVADALGLQPHHISQVVNEVEEKNFSDFINEYRVSNAIGLLRTTDYKVLHVAIDSGFNNKASFNNAFKKVTGMSPSQYRETQQTLKMR